MKSARCLIISYNQPDLFPPTLNAIDSISKIYDKLEIVTLHQFNTSWKYPINATIYYMGKNIDVKKLLKLTYIEKIVIIFKFIYKVVYLLLSRQYDLVILYDPFSTFIYGVSNILKLNRGKLWYHNHDILEKKYVKLFSPNWFALKFENYILKKVNIFTLPSDQRKVYFQDVKKYFCLPNYPSLKVYKSFSYPKNLNSNEPIKLIYQGRINKNHGLQEIVKFMCNTKFDILLFLKGLIDEEMEVYFNGLAPVIRNKISIFPFSDYNDVPAIINTCHIGLGIHTDNSIMVNTMGTASNKIYEYMACGLPVLLYNSEVFVKSFENVKWVTFTDLSSKNLERCIGEIVRNYNYLSKTAINDFTSKYNYDINFNKVYAEL